MNNPVQQSDADRRAVEAYQRDEDNAADQFVASARVLQFLVEKAIENPAFVQERLDGFQRVVQQTHAARVEFERLRRFRQEAQHETPALTVAQAALRTGIARSILQSAIRAGKLPSLTRIERGTPTTYIFREDADAFAARHRARQRGSTSQEG